MLLPLRFKISTDQNFTLTLWCNNSPVLGPWIGSACKLENTLHYFLFVLCSKCMIYVYRYVPGYQRQLTSCMMTCQPFLSCQLVKYINICIMFLSHKKSHEAYFHELTINLFLAFLLLAFFYFSFTSCKVLYSSPVAPLTLFTSLCQSSHNRC